MDYVKQLNEFKGKKKFFVGIDSDGCVFDTMELKHKECFIPNIIKHFSLQAVSKYARQVCEFVNLYSKWRGINRFPALVLAFKLLKKRKEVVKRKVLIPDLSSLEEWIEKETKLSNPALEGYVKENSDPVLKQVLRWSLSVNQTIKEMVKNVPPFPYVRESLEKLQDEADIIVVSQTPYEALKREWDEHKISDYVSLICGQEMGSKYEHIKLATKGMYEDSHILMIGDAPGDLKAAKKNNALFFPIFPGREDESWERFYKEGINRFLSNTFKGEYQEKLIEEFNKSLPEVPPWEES